MADVQLFSNNASSNLSAGIDGVTTTIVLVDGSAFSSPAAGQYAMATLQEGSSIEIVKITARTTNTLTVVRAQEGTSGTAFTTAATLSERMTAGTLGGFAQVDNGGDARGANSITLQPGRTTASYVASGANATAVGYSTTAAGASSVSIGDAADVPAGGTGAVAVGQTAVANAVDALCVGHGGAAEGVSSVAVGKYAWGAENYGIAIGDSAQTGQASAGTVEIDAVAIGHNAKAYQLDCVAIGELAVAGVSTGTAARYSVALGPSTSATATSAIAIGNGATAGASTAVAIGPAVVNNSTETVKIGSSNTKYFAIDFDNNFYLAAGFYLQTATSGITASATQTQGQQVLTTMINVVSTVATTNDVVTLPAAVDGMEVFIRNDGANTLQVFPNTGAQIDGGGANNSVTITAGTHARYMAYNSTNWVTV